MKAEEEEEDDEEGVVEDGFETVEEVGSECVGKSISVKRLAKCGAA